MKKFIYASLLVTISIMSFSSCTEEEVKPQTTVSGSSGTPEKDGF
jgi:hypothetical protein